MYKQLRQPLPIKQRGAVLIVGLIMLLLMTIVGLSSIRGSSMQELMAGSLRDRQISFQAAEAALRAAEADVLSAQPDVSGAVFGYMNENSAGGTANFWHTYDWEDANSVAMGTDIPMSAAEARYVVERLDVQAVPGADDSAVDLTSIEALPELFIYRITSRGVGMTDNSVSIVQSIYRRL